MLVIIEVHKKLMLVYPDVLTIIVPRYPSDGLEIIKVHLVFLFLFISNINIFIAAYNISDLCRNALKKV